MKKITLIASLVMACVFAQATNVNWGLTTGNKLDAKYVGGTAYLLFNAVTSEVFSYNGDLDNATSFSAANFKDTVLSSTTVDADGYFHVTESMTPDSTGLAKGTKACYMAIISADGKSMTVLPSTGTVNIQSSSLSSVFERTPSAFTQSYTAVVPEPTTVALLALGLAALGLKRKVA